MSDPTPREMLKLYREGSHTFDNEQAAMFVKLPASERMELLFYMMLHYGKILQHVHGLIDAEAAQTTGMPEPEKAN